MTITVPIPDVGPWLLANATWLGLTAWYIFAYLVVRRMARKTKHVETESQLIIWLFSPLVFPTVAVVRSLILIACFLFPHDPNST